MMINEMIPPPVEGRRIEPMRSSSVDRPNEYASKGCVRTRLGGVSALSASGVAVPANDYHRKKKRKEEKRERKERIARNGIVLIVCGTCGKSIEYL